MATWDNVVYTTQGLNLMAKLQTGAALEITRAIGSDGHVSADALPALTEITAKQTLTLSDAIYKGNGQALLPVTLYNRGLTEGYPLRQIGIYATDPDDGEVLMLVAQSETPDTIPTELASPDFVVNFSFNIALGNAGRINVTYSLTDMATRADLDNINAELANKANVSALGKPSGIATLNSSGKLVQMPTAADVGAAPINIRQIDIKPLVPDNGGDLMCRCWINPWREAHLMIRWSLRTPLTGTIDFARLPDECLPIMGFDTTCVLRSPSSGIEAGIVNIGWGGQISICRSTTSVNDTFTMLCANINYHTYY